ncbi:Zinc finger, BED-type [Dillenia turbinata]|uniref:Zinc finger, BED-type n=1 Tax=Dillenia turbinata TaxID=194707 RepID=A0AAN8YWW5_9MAGN
MASSETIDVHEHGTTVDAKKGKVQCHYCGKVVSGGFHRLKYHLGGIRGDVRPCTEVPTNVRETFRLMIVKTKDEHLNKEQGELNGPSSRNLSKTANKMKCTLQQDENSVQLEREHVYLPSEIGGFETPLNGSKVGESLPRSIQKLMGRFFYETGVDLSAAKSSSFQKLIDGTIAVGHRKYSTPGLRELRGEIFEEEVNEMKSYVRHIKESWPSTGCSIVLDGWTDKKGRKLVNFLVDCPKGVIYLRSSDISDLVGDVDGLLLFFEGVIEEVGFENVIQIVTDSTSDDMVAVGKQLREKHRSVFWTVSASHCIELMLDKIADMDLTRPILDKAKTITRFIHGHEAVLKLMRNHTCGSDLFKPSKSRSVMPFYTLENIVIEKESLQRIFISSEWETMNLASTTEGKRVAAIVDDSYFWSGAKGVLKATFPLINLMHLIHNSDRPLIAYIYEMMDQAKEIIKNKFMNKKADYSKFWKVIDGIWNSHLHSPLHAAGYYLNPSYIYSSNFFMDAEVAAGLLCCVVRMARDTGIQDLIARQIDVYRTAQGSFKHGSSEDQKSAFPPAVWWSNHGGQYPELQRMAIRILSQTCDGALRYNLHRTLAEKLLTKGRNQIEQQWLIDEACVHYNLHLRQFETDINSDTLAGEIDPMDDWIVDGKPEFHQSDNCGGRD